MTTAGHERAIAIDDVGQKVRQPPEPGAPKVIPREAPSSPTEATPSTAASFEPVAAWLPQPVAPAANPIANVSANAHRLTGALC
jgi:hypothetical protein